MEKKVITRVPSAPDYTGARCLRDDVEDVVISGLAPIPEKVAPRKEVPAPNKAPRAPAAMLS